MGVESQPFKVKAAIIGTGNIGSDLLIKIERSQWLKCSLFTGRSTNSEGIKRAAEKGVHVSTKSIDAIIEDTSCCDIFFDATNAESHKYHSKILHKLKNLQPRISSEKMPDGTLIAHEYEDVFPFLSREEMKENMIADKR